MVRKSNPKFKGLTYREWFFKSFAGAVTYTTIRSIIDTAIKKSKLLNLLLDAKWRLNNYKFLNR